MKELREKITIKNNKEKQNNDTKSNMFIFRDYCYKWLKSIYMCISLIELIYTIHRDKNEKG